MPFLPPTQQHQSTEGKNLCLSQARINWEGCGGKGIWQKMGNDGGGGIDSLDGVASSWIVGASASIVPSTIKSRRWRAIMKEVDEGCI